MELNNSPLGERMQEKAKYIFKRKQSIIRAIYYKAIIIKIVW